MAEEIKKIITVDTSQAVDALDKLKGATNQVDQEFNSMKDAKDKMDSLKAGMMSLDETSEEYASTLKELQTLQDKYNKVVSDAKGANDAAAGSYNALSKQMSDLKKAWKATADEAERNSIGQQILEINDKLKEFDASIGNYQRNVGNYATAFTEGFADMADGFDTMVPGVKQAQEAFGKLGVAMKALIANPIGAIIAALVTVFIALKKAISNNEKAMEAIKKAMKSFEPILNIVSNAIAWLGEKIAVVVDWLGTKLTGALEFVVNKGLNNFINGVIKGINFLIKPITTFSSWVIGAIEGIVSAINKVGKATGLFDISGAVDALDKAKNAVKDFEIGTVNLGLSFDKMSAKAETAADAEKQVADSAKEATDAINEQIAALEKEKAVIDERIKTAEKGSKEYYDLLREQENKDWEIQQIRLKNEGYTDEQIEAFRQAHIKALADIDQQQLDDADAAAQKRKEEEEKRAKEEAEAKKQAQEAEIARKREVLDAEIEVEQANQEQKKGLWEQSNEEYYNLLKEKENFEWELQEARLEAEGYTNEQIAVLREAHAKRLEEIDQASAETTKMAMADAVDAVASRTASVTGMIGDLFSALAENYDEGSKQSKAFQIAAATMNMLGGVVSAVASAFSPANAWMTIYGQAAAAAAMSATVIATGIAQIAKIKSTSTKGSSSASASTAPAPSTPSTTFSPQYTSNATGASDVVDLQNAVASGTKDGNKDTKVYVVESEITESQNASKTRVQESEF